MGWYSNYAWDGTAWDKLGGDVDLTAYLTKEEAGTTYATKAEIPTELPNPEALTIKYNGVQAFTYDGSTAETGNFIVNATTVPMSDSDSTTISAALAKKLDSTTADTTYAKKSEIPSKLPNPQLFTLQMNGTQVATYDGSTAQTGNFIVNAETVPMSDSDDTTISAELAKKLDSTTADSTYAKKSEIANKADKATTLAGYGIEDAYTKSQIDTSLSTKLSSQEASSTYATITSVEAKADKATTLAGYGITDAFTKNEVNTALNAKLDTATASTTYATKEELNSKVASVYKVKGSVANQAALPQEGNEVGDVYNVEDTGVNYVWTGEEWDSLGGSVDLTNYYTKGDVDSKLADKANTADVYSKTALDPMLEAKVDSADLGTMAYAETTDYSTKAVADTLYAPISLSETVAGKADSATTLEGYGITDAYTSSEVDAKLAEKASTADVQAIEEVVPETASTSNMLVDAASLQSKLNAKADSETVSEIQSTLLTKADKSEIPSKLPNPQSFTLQMNGTQVATYDGSTAQTGNVVVNATTVPMSGEDETTVSEALALKANTADVYTQTATDAKFALKTDVSTISGKIPEAASAENKLVDTNAMNTALADKANASDLGTMASKNADDYSTTEEANALYAPASISTTIEGKADKADTLAGYGITDAYTKSQVDTELGKKLDSTTASSTYATQTSVSTISGKIPEAASTDNLLVDTNAMNTALAGKANTADVYTKGEVDAKVSSVYKYKGSVENESALPQELCLGWYSMG